MAKKAVSPTDIYSLLPRTNCKECGEENCMAFAVKLVNRETVLEKCLPLVEDEKYKRAFEAIWDLIKPPVREVEIGSGDGRVKIGGEQVMHRHEMTYINPTAIAIDVTDEMNAEEIRARVEKVESFTYDYIGMELKLDMVAVRSVSSDPEKFGEAVGFLADNSELPLILCSLNPKVIKAGLSVVGEHRPLIYAATRENWREFAELALTHGCPLAAFSPGDLDGLVSLSRTLVGYGVGDLVLDPGTFPIGGLSKSIRDFTMLRWKACNEKDETVGFPLMGTPITAWLSLHDQPQAAAWWEACAAAALIDRYADLMIMHSLEGWSLMPIVILRDNIYTDPRKPVAVDPRVLPIGDPSRDSPVMLTSNFALTYYLVSSDIEAGKVDAHLLISDSEGLAVDAAVAGRKMTADSVAEAIREFEVDKLVDHRILIIPGKAARLSGEIEEETGWKVAVGPMDSSEIAKFIEQNWEGILAEAEAEGDSS